MAQDMLNKGKQLLEEVAKGCAGDHGLRLDSLEWEDQGYQWMLKVSDQDHTVRLIFSADEIEYFAEVPEDNRETKMRIRNAFASLAM